MKAPFKPSNKRHYLAITCGVTLSIFLLGVLPAAAQATKTPTSAAPASDPKNVASAAATAPASGQDALSEYNNWVTLGIGGAFVTGDKAQFQREKDTKSGVFGGLEDFHWQEFVGKDGTLTLDGHAIVGNHDYDFHLDYTDPKLGYIRAGYTEFRTWYDGNGGYWPPNNLSFSLYDNNLYVDRRSGWIEAGLTLPDLPVFAFRYEYDSRKGTMDSTSWGQTSLTTGVGTVKIVPTFLGIDETRNIFQGSITDKVDSTDVNLTLRYEIDETKDATFIDQNPGQATNVFVTDYDIEKNDIFNVHGFQKTFFNDNLTFSSGFSYVNTATDLGGSRMYGPAYNPQLYKPGLSTSQYINLSGVGSTNDYVMNMSLMFTPYKDLVIIPALRFQYQSSDLADGDLSAHASNTEYPSGATANNWTMSVAESLEARYNGFRDWSLYATGEWSEDWGDDDWNEVTTVVTPNNQGILAQQWSRFCQKYTIGANWYPISQLTCGGQYYHQIHEYNYAGFNATPQYPGYLQAQNFTTDDMNFRVTWHALSNLTLVTRYDLQYEEVDTTSTPWNGAAGPVGTIQSADMTNHIISENASWSPLSRLVLQAGGSYVINSVDTPIAGSAGINNIVLNGKNDYWTVDTSAGYALDDKTDLRVQYTYYRADDFANNAGSTVAGLNNGMPFGANTEEHNVSATITHQFNKALEGSLKYDFSKYRDGLSGGQDNYQSHLVYASMKYKF